MSFNNVQLPGFLVADLYKRHLVEDFSAVAKVEKSSEPAPIIDKPIQFLGKNIRQFVILVCYSNEVHLPEAQLEFLGNILKACQLNLGDVAIVNCNSQEVNFNNIGQLQPKQIITFGEEPPVLNDFRAPVSFEVSNKNGINIINAPKLELLNQNTPDGKVLKGRLWNSLKQLLNI
ncbi:hypothetical protein [Pinibacter soli]|uniref:DNA polymerase III subunit psi n=1 Tax=Pinibacter soli TaxID=3044211 RepID=A0ABT6RBD7_9BACT|nr:hypothetical protein [Pinibacter soli]MDI3319886.1 hypothetical protein [Pinibacter soli]